MANPNDKSVVERASPGPDLRLIDRRAFVGFPELVVAPGLRIADFALQIPDVTFPFNVTGGPSRYQRKKLDFGYLELEVDAELVMRKVAALSGGLGELDELKLHFRPGYLEGQARLRTAERPALTFKLAFDGDGERLAVYVYDVRYYGFSVIPAPQIPLLLSEQVRVQGLLPDVELRGANGFTARILPPLVQQAAVSRGYRVPSLTQARLSTAEVSGKGLRLRFAAGGLPPPAPPDEELLLALEGARAFADAEELLAAGKLKEARDAYLRHGDASEAHPFAAERLLALLVADPQAHELVTDIAATLARRRENSATALWADAVVRERRGESARAAERFLALCNLSRKQQEEAAALFAAEAAARAARDQAPQMAVRALHELLGLKPDHLPSLKALAKASDRANDRAGAIRAYRRIAALARDPAESADAHVHMARLCALTEDDVAGARLHCEAALRLAPDHPEALYQLGELCFRGGEHLRAIKALDRLRDVAMTRHEVDRVGRADLLAGRIWEEGLKQPENALLRYREAVALLPTEPEPFFFAGRVAEGLGKLQEALSAYQQCIELAGPAPRSPETRRAAHQAHHAMSRLAKSRLGEPAKAREHLEAALALDPTDLVAIDELLPYFRASGKAAELADACEKAAAVVEEPARRAALWAEAGELYRGRLNDPEKAEKLLTSALEADARNRSALEGMLALAEARRDGAQLCRCLRALAELSPEPKDRARYFRRLAVAARDLSFDLELAASALSEVLKVEPDDLPSLGELCAIQRRRADMSGLAAALEARAAGAERSGDKRLASAALRELAQVLEVRLGRTGEALVALERAARLSSDQAVLLDLANLSLRCERPQNARRALEDLLALLPKHAAAEKVAEVKARLGAACEMLGDNEAAKGFYAQAFPLRRFDDELAARLEALYEDAGQLKELTTLWADRAQALLSSGRTLEAAPLFFKSAQAFLKMGEQAEALRCLGSALEAAPQGPQAGEALETMAELELARGERGEAARLYARRAEWVTDRRAAARLLFKAATLVAKSPREPGYVAAALEKDGTYAPARLRRAELSLESEPRSALADLEAVLAVDPLDVDAPPELERVSLMRRAGSAALRAGQSDAARKHLVAYAAQRPDDLDARRELAALHRKVGAKEALCELLAELWPHYQAAEQKAARREYAELCLELGRTAAATDVLRVVFEAGDEEGWAARKLLSLLRPPDCDEAEYLNVLGAVIRQAKGEERVELLCRRARHQAQAGRLGDARSDLTAAAQTAVSPGHIHAELAELARRMGDERLELEDWRAAALAEPTLSAQAARRLVTLASARLAARDAQHARRGYEAARSLPVEAAVKGQAFLGLADACLALDDGRGAREALASAAKEGSGEQQVEALLRLAGLLETDGELVAAADALDAALKRSPELTAAKDGLRRVLARAQSWERLASLLAAEAERRSDGAAAALFSELGALQADKLGQPAGAEESFRRAVALDAADLGSLRRLAALLTQRGALAEAAHWLERAAELSTAAEAAALLRQGARAATQAENRPLALRLALKADALVPATGAELVDLVDRLCEAGAYQEALAHQQKRVGELGAELGHVAPEEAETAILRLADIAEKAGTPQVAENALRRLVAARPTCGAAVERLAAMVEAARPREAIELLAAYLPTLPAEAGVARRLEELAARAAEALADTDLAARLLREAVRISPEPLAARAALVRLFREAARTPELMAELRELGQVALAKGDLAQAAQAYEEQALLAEQSGRVDEALASLQSMVDICLREKNRPLAARCERRRAELLRDAKLDLEGAEAALDHAWSLDQEPVITQLGVSLSRARRDLAACVRWLSRTAGLQSNPTDRAKTLLEVGRLQMGHGELMPAGATSAEEAAQAEAALKEALRLEPGLGDAQELLATLYERDGRMADLAGLWEEVSVRASTPTERATLLRRAAALYREKAGMPQEAAAALLAARAALPDDLSLTAEAADLLHAVGRASDAADLDALLLEANPFHPCFERQVSFLEEAGDARALAALMLRRAERERGEQAATSYLRAAAAFRKWGGEEQARLCESQAFEAWPASDQAFAPLRARAAGEPRRLAELLAERARALPDAAAELLKERAQLLGKASEGLLCAQAWDDYLAVVPEDVEALTARGELAAQAGGAAASRPYDRKLLAVAGDTVPAPVRLKLLLRLGNAALDARAYQDAGEVLQAAAELDPEGERGREALSLLSEVYARTQNQQGLYATTLRLAREARPDEAEALYRRAAALYDEPTLAIDALVSLSKLRPAEKDVVEQTARALTDLGRLSELFELYQRAAAAAGGSDGASWLLAAARLAETELADEGKARALRLEAGRMDPANLEALRVTAEEQRRAGQQEELLASLPRLLAAARDAAEESSLRLELAQLWLSRGEKGKAREQLESVAARGRAAPGYAAALEALEPILVESGDDPALGKVLAARAELAQGARRAELFIAAGTTLRRTGAAPQAEALVRQGLASQPSTAGFVLLGELALEQGEPAKAAPAFVEAAELAAPEVKGNVLLRAADAWEAGGQQSQASELLQRVARDFPHTLESEVLSERFTRLGAHGLALTYGFRPALTSGRPERALALAEAAGEADRVLEALWAATRAGPGFEAKLAAALEARGEHAELLELAELCEARGQASLRDDLAMRVVLARVDEPLRARALDHVVRAGRLPAAVASALEPSAPDQGLVRMLLDRARALGPEDGAPLLEQLVPVLDAEEGSSAQWEELSGRQLLLGRKSEAARSLERAIATETQGGRRASLRLALATLQAEALELEEQAVEQWKLALREDPSLRPAAERLLRHYAGAREWEPLLETARTVSPSLTDAALTEHRSSLAEACEALGKTEEALALLVLLPETPELLARQASLLERSGRTSDALALQERLAQTPDSLGKVLDGYFAAQLLPGAARVARRLLEQELPAAERRRIVERLSPTVEGAALATAEWPRLLRDAPADADGWTLFAEALRYAGREDESRFADEFGAALVGSTAPASPPAATGTLAPPRAEFEWVYPGPLVPVLEETMPRLHGAAHQALAALGVTGLEVFLFPAGGVEAYLLSPRVLVLGAGALGAFGPGELPFLCALALCLEERGETLARPGPVPGFAQAALKAFEACPAPLAAARVLAHLDERVRGGDPSRVDPSELLPTSAAFCALLTRALERLQR